MEIRDPGDEDEDTESHPAIFQYQVGTGEVALVGRITSPTLGPRSVSVNQDGSAFVTGWLLLNSSHRLLAQFPYPTGRFNLGSHAFDDSRDFIYSNLPTPKETSDEPSTLPSEGEDGPVLTILDSDNLTVRERLRLAESLTSKSILSSDRQTMYSASDSGATILPIGSLDQTHRITSVQEDLLFQSSSADPAVISQDLEIVNPGGGNTSFRLTTDVMGVQIFPESGTTPATVRVEVDPAAFIANRGTTQVVLEIQSSAAINIPFPVRVLVNTRDVGQAGTLVNVPGKLVDILADPVRDRFYILRQDRNLVLVFDGTTMEQIGSFRTGNTPTQMALTRDAKYMMVGNDNSKIANVYDLDTMETSEPIIFPGNHYPRTIAASNNQILATARVAGLCRDFEFLKTTHCVDFIDFDARVASSSVNIGIFLNDIHQDSVLTASPSGKFVFLAMPNGTVALYEAEADTFVAARQDFSELGGALTTWSDDLHVVGDKVLNRSLVPIGTLETVSGIPTGLALLQGDGLRTTSPSTLAPGIIQRVNLGTFEGIRPVPMAESPLIAEHLPTEPIGQIGQTILPFLRTLAPLSNGASIISLSISGFTVLPTDFDGGSGPGAPSPEGEPIIQRLVNLADGSIAVASGGLISILGSKFSVGEFSASGTPLPNILGGASVRANGTPVPLLFVSPNRIDAQMPFSVAGNVNLEVRTGAGVSSPISFTVLSAAPAVFRTATAGPLTGLPSVIRSLNNEPVTLSNPTHPDDVLMIFATGLGLTTPEVPSGFAAPSDPLALALQEPVVSIGGVEIPVSFAGLVPGYVGLYQINARVTADVPEGLEVPLTIRQGVSSTTLNVRVVK